MEFLYRSIHDRGCRSSPLPPVAPSTPGSGSADSHHGDGPAERIGNSAVTIWQPDLPPSETAGADADELRRQAEKARIRERILREEAEQWELELEVRSELREQMLRLPWPVLGRSVRGSDMLAALSTGTITAANSSLPVVALEAHSKANTLATAPTKRKSPDRATGALLVPSSKKQKSALTCMVSGITANSEKTMQDHLNAKVHKRKGGSTSGAAKASARDIDRAGGRARGRGGGGNGSIWRLQTDEVQDGDDCRRAERSDTDGWVPPL